MLVAPIPHHHRRQSILPSLPSPYFTSPPSPPQQHHFLQPQPETSQPFPYYHHLASYSAPHFSNTCSAVLPSDFAFTDSSDFLPFEGASSHSFDFNFSSSQQQRDVEYRPQEHRNPHNLRIHVYPPNTVPRTADLMPSEQATAGTSWSFGQLTPTSARTHQRESSLSSLGSAGPASPYSHNTSHPQVALPTDPVAGDSYYDADSPYNNQHATIFPKTLTPSHTPQHDSFLDQSFPGYNLQAFSNHHIDNNNFLAMMAIQKQQSSDTDDATNTADRTPSGSANDCIDRRNYSRNAVPKLDRTISDVYQDELYSPSFTITSAAPARPSETGRTALPQGTDVFSQRLQAANNQHLSASANSPAAPSRDRASPFRQGSPLAPPPTFSSTNARSHQVRLGSASQLREQQKAEADAQVIQQQLKRVTPHDSSPKTISPKDALLDYHETDEDASMPLFPSHESPQYRVQNIKQETPQSDGEESSSQQSFRSMATSRRESATSQATSQTFNFVPPSVPGRVQVPQQYSFVSQPPRQPSNMSDRTLEFPASLRSMESSSSSQGQAPDGGAEIQKQLQKPAGAQADAGTYTCTYHGCTLRFETPAKLQKHKREGHRQSAPLTSQQVSPPRATSTDSASSGMTSAALSRNSQAGPHKCDRINPSTGKPCNTIFSRPYDLTRHEDTIHNARKQKVRCHLCTEEKTFSRNDALTRHMRVVHPEVDFPGKTRRRGHD